MAYAPADPNAPEFVRRYVNLADAQLGARTLAVSDDFFAAAERMLNPEPAVFIPGKYDAHGKWMDGWESRIVAFGFGFCKFIAQAVCEPNIEKGNPGDH